MGLCSCSFRNQSDYIVADNINGKTKITIDNVTYELSNIKTLYNDNGTIYADGKTIIHTNCRPEFHVNIDGSVGNISTVSGHITVKGPIHSSIKTTSGDLQLTGNVQGNINTVSGNVTASAIKGNVSNVSGDIYR
jgi:hypothetical protein